MMQGDDEKPAKSYSKKHEKYDTIREWLMLVFREKIKVDTLPLKF